VAFITFLGATISFNKTQKLKLNILIYIAKLFGNTACFMLLGSYKVVAFLNILFIIGYYMLLVGKFQPTFLY
jgi:TRAP-type C4-dicarboxylate transport system permease small subunit